jgi:hypothetical protein
MRSDIGIETLTSASGAHIHYHRTLPPVLPPLSQPRLPGLSSGNVYCLIKVLVGCEPAEFMTTRGSKTRRRAVPHAPARYTQTLRTRAIRATAIPVTAVMILMTRIRSYSRFRLRFELPLGPLHCKEHSTHS